jgi:hypothetical protein
LRNKEAELLVTKVTHRDFQKIHLDEKTKMKRKSINFIGISDVSRGKAGHFGLVYKGINDAPEKMFIICLMNYLRILRMLQRLYYDEGSKGAITQASTIQKRELYSRANYSE